MTATGGTLPGQTITLGALAGVSQKPASAAEQSTAWQPKPKMEPRGGTEGNPRPNRRSRPRPVGLKITTEFNWS